MSTLLIHNEMYTQEIKKILESSQEEVLTESLVMGYFNKLREFFSIDYDHDFSKKIISDYLDEYRVEEVKAYITYLYVMSQQEKPKGVLKTVYFTLSQANRSSFYTYRVKINQLISFAEIGIRKIEKSNFNAKLYIKNKLEQLESDPEIKSTIEKTSEVQTPQQLIVVTGSEIQGLINKDGSIIEWLRLIGEFAVSFIKIAIDILGWALKIIISIVISIALFLFFH